MAVNIVNTETYDRTIRGSRMPLDTEIHWSWSNPLNIFPAILLLFVLAALIGALIA